MSTARHSVRLAEGTIGSTIPNTVAALPIQTELLRTSMVAQLEAIPGLHGRQTRARTRVNSAAGNRQVLWTAGAAAGNRQERWIAAVAVGKRQVRGIVAAVAGNRQAQWIAGAAARIA
jgi:hypothetical protein